MSNASVPWSNIHFFDELAAKRTVIHRLHPLAKLLTVLAFLVTVASFGRYAVAPLLPLCIFPVALLVLADLPAGELFKRMLIASPFALGVSVFNPLLDHSTAVIVGGFVITGGWVSFCSIVLRFVLSVLAALILVAVSGIGQVGDALLKLWVPRAFVVQLIFLYRYISVLAEETTRTLRAYSLRSAGRKGVHYRAWGSLAGQLLLRTIDRASRIYQAMRCRGFDGEIRMLRSDRFRWADLLFIVGWIGFFAATRMINLTELIGSIALGVGR